jgi:hypothetical protein
MNTLKQGTHADKFQVKEKFSQVFLRPYGLPTGFLLVGSRCTVNKYLVAKKDSQSAICEGSSQHFVNY